MKLVKYTKNYKQFISEKIIIATGVGMHFANQSVYESSPKNGQLSVLWDEYNLKDSKGNIKYTIEVNVESPFLRQG